MPMPKLNDFGIAIPGKAHILAERNCQDHSFFRSEKDRFIGIVADGIGSITYSEFSSFLYSTSFLTFVSNLPLEDLNQWDLSEIFDGHILKINKLLSSVIDLKYLDFSLGSTVVMYIITEETTSIYSKGDGFYGANNKLVDIKGNHSYIDLCSFERNLKLPTTEINSVWVSTDGLRYSSKLKDQLCDLPNQFATIFNSLRFEMNNEILRDDLGICVSVRD